MLANHFIEQFEDKPLAHYSYALLSQGEIILIDPARNPQPYYDFAQQHHAKIMGIIETHPHADFVSSHLEISQTTGATIYTSKLVNAHYAHHYFDDGEHIKLGKIILKAINTPGHSPDSICIILENEGKDVAVFTGDTLFIGDCGRPDLRKNAGNITATREALAVQLYHSLRNKLMVLDKNVWVYPAHGAGTLCGKALSKANSSTIGAECASNWCLQPLSELDFVQQLITEQPFIPQYFDFNVALNQKGAANFALTVADVPIIGNVGTVLKVSNLANNTVIIDTRPENMYKQGHLKNSINLMIGLKFETWLGTIIAPNEAFYLTAETKTQLNQLIERIAKIGYETSIKAAFISVYSEAVSDIFNLQHFLAHQNQYTIVDVRNTNEANEKPIFAHSINIPLAQLRNRLNEIALDKPIVVHCAGGYRSAAASSILKALNNDVLVYDFGEAISGF
jgi:hydroxyacylglutathione hydrolase